MESITLNPIPTALNWQVAPERHTHTNEILTISAGPRSDLFISPQGDAIILNAPRLLFTPDGDFQLSALVSAEFASTFDAGVLLVYSGNHTWAKLCLEYSPLSEPMVVSVVTRGVSDDANSILVPGGKIFMRISRMGPAFAFHVSSDGSTWQLIRHFALGEGTVTAGFLAQSPTGEGCTATFEQIAYSPTRLKEIRSGE